MSAPNENDASFDAQVGMVDPASMRLSDATVKHGQRLKTQILAGAQKLHDSTQGEMQDSNLPRPPVHGRRMSRRGECWDNAAMESFFSTLKTERYARTVCQTGEQARTAVFDYIERFYNPFRKHTKN